MNQKTFVSAAAILFSLIALLQLLRLIYGWEAVIGGVFVPMWASVVAVVVAGYLAYSGMKLRKSV